MNLAPVSYRRFASRAAPLHLFERLYHGHEHAFLYESLEAHGGRGRYSFLGGAPLAILTVRDGRSFLTEGAATRELAGAPLDVLRELNQPLPGVPPVAPFCGGLVGYLGYDAVRWSERIPNRHPRRSNAPDACFLAPSEVVCFDHLDRVVHVLVFGPGDHEARSERIRAALAALPDEPARREAVAAAPAPPIRALPAGVRATIPREQFEQMVQRAQEYIRAGDVFQVVLSQRFEFALQRAPLDVYRALRRTNPSPYMYYLTLGDLQIAGSSPEVLVRTAGRRVVTRPLAGTRPRGATPGQDEALAAELRSDPKERAEHVMLVDLGRNDLGRVCEFGSVEVCDVLEVERHSRVMHLVSTVEGWLRDGADGCDVFAATFPAGTVSGAPKVRAMEIIDELEAGRREVYAGAIGYFSLLGDVDLCIAIRTIVMQGGTGYLQAGAGVVADSQPAAEYQETLNKASALLHAIAAE